MAAVGKGNTASPTANGAVLRHEPSLGPTAVHTARKAPPTSKGGGSQSSPKSARTLPAGSTSPKITAAKAGSPPRAGGAAKGPKPAPKPSAKVLEAQRKAREALEEEESTIRASLEQEEETEFHTWEDDEEISRTASLEATRLREKREAEEEAARQKKLQLAAKKSPTTAKGKVKGPAPASTAKGKKPAPAPKSPAKAGGAATSSASEQQQPTPPREPSSSSFNRSVPPEHPNGSAGSDGRKNSVAHTEPHHSQSHVNEHDSGSGAFLTELSDGNGYSDGDREERGNGVEAEQSPSGRSSPEGDDMSLACEPPKPEVVLDKSSIELKAAKEVSKMIKAEREKRTKLLELLKAQQQESGSGSNSSLPLAVRADIEQLESEIQELLDKRARLLSKRSASMRKGKAVRRQRAAEAEGGKLSSGESQAAAELPERGTEANESQEETVVVQIADHRPADDEPNDQPSTAHQTEGEEGDAEDETELLKTMDDGETSKKAKAPKKPSTKKPVPPSGVQSPPRNAGSTLNGHPPRDEAAAAKIFAQFEENARRQKEEQRLWEESQKTKERIRELAAEEQRRKERMEEALREREERIQKLEQLELVRQRSEEHEAARASRVNLLKDEQAKAVILGKKSVLDVIAEKEKQLIEEERQRIETILGNRKVQLEKSAVPVMSGSTLGASATGTSIADYKSTAYLKMAAELTSKDRQAKQQSMDLYLRQQNKNACIAETLSRLKMEPLSNSMQKSSSGTMHSPSKDGAGSTSPAKEAKEEPTPAPVAHIPSPPKKSKAEDAGAAQTAPPPPPPAPAAAAGATASPAKPAESKSQAQKPTPAVPSPPKGGKAAPAGKPSAAAEPAQTNSAPSGAGNWVPAGAKAKGNSPVEPEGSSSTASQPSSKKKDSNAAAETTEKPRMTDPAPPAASPPSKKKAASEPSSATKPSTKAPPPAPAPAEEKTVEAKGKEEESPAPPPGYVPRKKKVESGPPMDGIEAGSSSTQKEPDSKKEAAKPKPTSTAANDSAADNNKPSAQKKKTVDKAEASADKRSGSENTKAAEVEKKKSESTPAAGKAKAPAPEEPPKKAAEQKPEPPQPEAKKTEAAPEQKMKDQPKPAEPQPNHEAATQKPPSQQEKPEKEAKKSASSTSVSNAKEKPSVPPASPKQQPATEQNSKSSRKDEDSAAGVVAAAVAAGSAVLSTATAAPASKPKKQQQSASVTVPVVVSYKDGNLSGLSTAHFDFSYRPGESELLNRLKSEGCQSLSISADTAMKIYGRVEVNRAEGESVAARRKSKTAKKDKDEEEKSADSSHVQSQKGISLGSDLDLRELFVEISVEVDDLANSMRSADGKGKRFSGSDGADDSSSGTKKPENRDVVLQLLFERERRDSTKMFAVRCSMPGLPEDVSMTFSTRLNEENLLGLLRKTLMGSLEDLSAEGDFDVLYISDEVHEADDGQSEGTGRGPETLIQLTSDRQLRDILQSHLMNDSPTVTGTGKEVGMEAPPIRLKVIPDWARMLDAELSSPSPSSSPAGSNSKKPSSSGAAASQQGAERKKTFIVLYEDQEITLSDFACPLEPKNQALDKFIEDVRWEFELFSRKKKPASNPSGADDGGRDASETSTNEKKEKSDGSHLETEHLPLVLSVTVDGEEIRIPEDDPYHLFHDNVVMGTPTVFLITVAEADPTNEVRGSPVNSGLAD